MQFYYVKDALVKRLSLIYWIKQSRKSNDVVTASSVPYFIFKNRCVYSVYTLLLSFVGRYFSGTHWQTFFPCVVDRQECFGSLRTEKNRLPSFPAFFILFPPEKGCRKNSFFHFLKASTLSMPIHRGIFKGTVAWDGFPQCWQKLTDPGLIKCRGWFLNFSEAPLILRWNKTSSFW